MKKDIISIVVPIYNVEKYLDKCIDSITNQTYKNLEILLIDDGSTDDCPKICDKWAKKDSRIKVYHKKNGGLSDARNYGIERAKGKYIGFIDSDDWVELDMYENLYREIVNNEVDIVICGRFIEYENSYTIEQKANEKVIMDKKEALIKLNSFAGFDMAAWDKLYKKSLFNDIEFPFGKKCEDAYIAYKLFEKCKKIEYYPQCYYHYLQRKYSISKSNTLNMDFIYAAKEQLEFFKNKYSDILDVAETNYAFSVKIIYEIAIERKIEITKELKDYKKEIKKYRKAVRENKYIGKRKKLVFILFNDFYIVYLILKKIKIAIQNQKLSD